MYFLPVYTEKVSEVPDNIDSIVDINVDTSIISETKQRVKKKELKNKLSACPTINCDGKGNLNPNSKSTRHWSARNCPNKRNLFIKI